MFVSSYKRGSKEWWNARIAYRMDAMGGTFFIIAIIVSALVGYHDKGWVAGLCYGGVAWIISEIIMQILERVDL